MGVVIIEISIVVMDHENVGRLVRQNNSYIAKLLKLSEVLPITPHLVPCGTEKSVVLRGLS